MNKNLPGFTLDLKRNDGSILDCKSIFVQSTSGSNYIVNKTLQQFSKRRGTKKGGKTGKKLSIECLKVKKMAGKLIKWRQMERIFESFFLLDEKLMRRTEEGGTGMANPLKNRGI